MAPNAIPVAARLWMPTVNSVLVLALVVLWAGCVEGQQGFGRCSGFNCKTRCLSEPQRCDECCPTEEDGRRGGQTGGTDSERLAELEREVSEVKVLVGVLVGLVVVMVVLVGAGVFLYLSRHCHASTLTLPLFLRGKAARQKAKEASKVDVAASCRVQPDPTAVRIAHYQNRHSPLGRRASTGRRPTATSSSPPSSTEDHHHPHYPPKQRTRQPSESSSPDDPSSVANTTSTTPDHPHAYHNLALSTSTLHGTSSTSTLAPAISTITLDTTLASGNMHNDNSNVQSSPPHTRI